MSIGCREASEVGFGAGCSVGCALLEDAVTETEAEGCANGGTMVALVAASGRRTRASASLSVCCALNVRCMTRLLLLARDESLAVIGSSVFRELIGRDAEFERGMGCTETTFELLPVLQEGLTPLLEWLCAELGVSGL